MGEGRLSGVTRTARVDGHTWGIAVVVQKVPAVDEARGCMAKERHEGSDQDLVRLYLDEIGRYPLLTKDDEASLARAIEIGRDAGQELAAPAVPAAKRRQLRTLVRDGERANHTFINANLRLVVSIAKKYQSSDMPLLDLIQ